MGAYGISAQNIDFWLFPEVKEISSIIERLSPSVCSGNENNWIGLFVLKTSKNFETNSIEFECHIQRKSSSTKKNKKYITIMKN